MTSSGWQNVAAPIPEKAAMTIFSSSTPAAPVIVCKSGFGQGREGAVMVIPPNC